MNRRHFFASAVAATAASRLSAQSIDKAAADPAYVIKNHGIKHSVMGWCFNPMNTLVLAKHAKDMGIVGIEGIDRKYYPEVKALGLDISLASGHGFANGPCNPKFRDEVITKLNEGIDVAASVGCKKIITFTGMKFEGMDRDKAIKDCLDTWKVVLPHAEKQGITLVLEHLNSRDNTHPMKGHPGYFGDDLDFCVDLIKQIGSPNFKLLFDIYHVSIMNGDIIRRLRIHKEYVGHIHTAGNPGRCELDEHQEINYPAVMQALLEIGYHDFAAHEFIPTWSDPVLALRHAAMVCDV